MKARLFATVIATACALSGGCTVGEGVGTIRGALTVPICNVNDGDFDLAQDFYGGEWHEGSLLIHISRGGENGEFGDEFVLRVDDTGYVARHLGERIAIGPAGVAPVQAVLRLNRLCGRQSITRYAPVVALEGFEGYAVFRSVYRGDPNADAPARLTHVSEFSVALRDPRDFRNTRPDREFAENAPREPAPLPPARGELEGSFQFYFSRGRPAQRFQ
ncbi:MAG: hypothetical protein JNK72_01765 [Myxococcales bacterium]|nr:hypothetical protein [Myxococcales bacterium]